VPLFLGGLIVGGLGMRALWLHWDLVDRLAREREAYVISEVLAYASREATTEKRQSFATAIRARLREPGIVFEPRVILAAEELEALACELDDGELSLDPACAFACMRLLVDFAESPLLNPALPPEDLRSRVRQIRSGFGHRQGAQPSPVGSDAFEPDFARRSGLCRRDTDTVVAHLSRDCDAA
jgi:hypothetical protein